MGMSILLHFSFPLSEIRYLIILVHSKYQILHIVQGHNLEGTSAIKLYVSFTQPYGFIT